MPSESRDLHEQEHSIKARGKELFVGRLEQENLQPAKPFPTYLRETPAQPFSAGTKAVLWMVGIVVAALLFAAIWRVSTRHGRRAPKSPRPAATTAMLESPAGFLWTRDAPGIPVS
jgi:hypothetical protein